MCIPDWQLKGYFVLNSRRSSVGVGVLAGLIYAVGGYDGNSRQCLSSVEVYDPEKDVWTRVTDMSARRSGVNFINLF